MGEWREAADLAAAVLFIVGVMRLRRPDSARSGNVAAAAGMALALGVSFIGVVPPRFLLVAAAVLVGVGAGVALARRVRLTAMPQLVALFNGMGGGAAALVALTEILGAAGRGLRLPAAASVPAAFTVAAGSISMAGSLIAFGKLQELVTGRPVTYGGQRAGNAAVAATAVALAAVLVVAPAGFSPTAAAALVAISLALGVLGVLPIGGADMPVVISLLNALTGLAAAATGFVLSDPLLIVAGALVGASGTVLTQVMSRAMHRSLRNVLFGAFGQSSRAAADGQPEGEPVHETSVDEVATLLAYARRVVIVPGYGLAVARAQQELRDLFDTLLERGVDVRFGIHPVAGRMPGHMNVLLAEADLPYDRMYEPASINPEFPTTDVALVVGANDVTNPAARTDPSSPIYGMPILDVDRARATIVLKRSMAPGFAGVDNPLYHLDRTLMLFGDARGSLAAILAALHEAAA